jgi:ribosome recycling factor
MDWCITLPGSPAYYGKVEDMAKTKPEDSKDNMSAEDVLKDVDDKMDKTVQVFANEVKGIRTGRATPALLENVRVEYYGSPTPLKQIANISVPEPRMMVVKPFDATVIKNIEKSLLKSDLGLTPNSDGRILRINVPPLSEERRKQLVHQVKDMAEKTKVTVRNIRRDGNRRADQMKKDSTLGEDDVNKLKDKIQDKTKTYEGKIDTMYEDKSKEIMEI